MRGLPPDHPRHSRIPGDCRMPATRITGRRRTAGPHRDPAVQAGGTAEGRNKLTDSTEGDQHVPGPGDEDQEDGWIRFRPLGASVVPSQEEIPALEEIPDTEKA